MAEPIDPQDPSSVTTTGIAEVDAVLSGLARLEGRPVQEHVAVLEEAHQQLRAALDGPAGSGAADGS